MQAHEGQYRARDLSAEFPQQLGDRLRPTGLNQVPLGQHASLLVWCCSLSLNCCSIRSTVIFGEPGVDSLDLVFQLALS